MSNWGFAGNSRLGQQRPRANTGLIRAVTFCFIPLAACAKTLAAHLACSQEDECMNPLCIWALSI